MFLSALVLAFALSNRRPWSSRAFTTFVTLGLNRRNPLVEWYPRALFRALFRLPSSSCAVDTRRSGETSQRLDSFVDFCGRARTLESSTNDSNLFNESFGESFDESFAFWVFKITQIHNLKKFWWKQYQINFCNGEHSLAKFAC
jgi:hypothetical protein